MTERVSPEQYDNPPSNWYEGTTRVGNDDVYVALGDTPEKTLVWHWCSASERWEGAHIGLHTIAKRDPLTIIPSLYRPDCCGWHGFITNGQWYPA